MSEGLVTSATIRAALAGDGAAVRVLVDELSPVVHARIVRALGRSGARARSGRDARQEIEDFVQEVFAALFDDDGKALRAWDASRGLSLANWVGVVTEHQVASILRSGRRNPWTEEPTVDGDLEVAAGASDVVDDRLHSRQVLEELDRRLRAELSPRGLVLFQQIVVEERAVESVCADHGLTADAVYAWRSRLGKIVRRIAAEITGIATSDPTATERSPGGEPRAS